MDNIVETGEQSPGAIEPYSMHVSSRYLELTRKKLELTRLPHELLLPEDRRWQYGTPKSILEPLVDFWLEQYDWRTQESHYNTLLPQFRTTITPTDQTHPPLRLHYVHQPCRLAADPQKTLIIPLLFCHDYPSSFLDVSNILEALTNPAEDSSLAEVGGSGRIVAFHVVAPSIPGMGFSDASSEEEFGLRQTADLFDGLMKRLGYQEYVAYGAGWGFSICRMLALHHSASCLAVHTTNPSFPAPSLRRTPLAYLKYQVARITKARIPGLSFDYLPTDFSPSVPAQHIGISSHANGTICPTDHPQTLAYSLCDSPAGLLATTIDALQPSLSGIATPSKPASPSTTPTPSRPSSASIATVWTPTTLLNWTMMRWLPGPEASLRWLRRAEVESQNGDLHAGFSNVPLGISRFGRSGGGVVGWAGAWWRVGWVKRREGGEGVVERAEWEAPGELVVDLREGVSEMVERGVVRFKGEGEGEGEGEGDVVE